MLDIHGSADARFDAVRETFSENFRDAGEIGAAVAVTVDGDPVVDLWGGHADLARTRPWDRDTLVNVYSTTKGVTAICALRLVEQGRIDLDAPVSDYWPEFAAAGKGAVPFRWLLSHRSGLPAVREALPPEALYDSSAMAAALAATEPWWVPGEKHGYHAFTYGWLVGEVVARVTGKSLGSYFREEIALPMGLDFHIGLDEKEHDRVAEMSAFAVPEPGASMPNLAELFVKEPDGMIARAFTNPPSMMAGANNAAWRVAEIPAANGHGTARALAALYGALARGGEQDGFRVLSAETIASCHVEQSSGLDEVLGITTRIGPGFMLSQDTPGGSFGPNARAFGHPGAGGSVAFADPDARVGFGYVMNKMGPHILLDPRATALIDATYRCL